eukprot:21756_1
MSSLCVPLTTSRIIYLSISIISGMSAIIIVIYGICKSTSLKQLQLLKPFLITYYITCTLWLISIIGYILFESLPYWNLICAKPNSFVIINCIFGVSMGFCGYLFALIGIYCLFLLRLKYSFLNTILQLSNRKFYLLSSGIFIQIAMIISTAYYYITFQWHIGLIISYLSIIINAIYSLSLLVLFMLNICRLQNHFATNVVKEAQQNKRPQTLSSNTELTTTIQSPDLVSVTSTQESININTIHNQHPHNHLAEITVKFAICASFAFISSILVNFMSFYRGFIASKDTFELLLIHVTLNIIDCLVTVICLHLQFSYANRWYIKGCKCLRIPLKSYVLEKFDEKYIEKQDVLHKEVKTETGESE